MPLAVELEELEYYNAMPEASDPDRLRVLRLMWDSDDVRRCGIASAVRDWRRAVRREAKRGGRGRSPGVGMTVPEIVELLEAVRDELGAAGLERFVSLVLEAAAARADDDDARARRAA